LGRLVTITPALNPIPGSVYGTTGSALYTAAGQNFANYASPCLQIGTAFGLDQWFYCLSAAGQQGYKTAREAVVHYQVIGDVKADTAFANNLAAQKASVAAGSFTAGSFTAAQLAKTNTIDVDYASVMLSTAEGSAFNTVLTVIGSDPGNIANYIPCAKWIIDPAPSGNFANVRTQISRQGSTTLNTALGIKATDMAAVTSPLVYDILLQPFTFAAGCPGTPANCLPYNPATSATTRAGLGLVCGTGGIAPFTTQYGAAYGSVMGDCSAVGTSIIQF
jgi:hypothetical protein